MKKLRGFTLIELLIVVAIIAILAAIAIPNFLEAQTRSKVARAKSDMRSLGTAIESYYIDYNLYPAVALELNAKALTTADRATFRFRGTTTLSTLTTPVAFITSYPADPFADTKGLIFGYFATGGSVWNGTANIPITGDAAVPGGWILTSFGPDTDENAGSTTLPHGDIEITGGTLAKVDKAVTAYNATISQPSVLLLTGAGAGGAYTYDPTNGTTSEGDVYRVKQ